MYHFGCNYVPISWLYGASLIELGFVLDFAIISLMKRELLALPEYLKCVCVCVLACVRACVCVCSDYSSLWCYGLISDHCFLL